jgi:undecaprenyl-diphosphatase
LQIARGLLAGLRDARARETAEWRLGLFIVLGTIPIGLLGLAFKHPIEHQLRTLELIGAALVVVGLVLGRAETAGSQERSIDDLTPRDAAVIGVAQAAALVPGVSRSGATISAGLFLGLDRVAATRYSFLLSIPAITLSGLYELKDAGTATYGTGATVLATAVAFVVGYASIAWLLRFITTNTFRPFVLYRVAIGALVIGLAAADVIR